MKADVPGSGGARSFGFRLLLPTTFSRLLMWFACHLSWLPSHVAEVPVGGLGGAMRFSLCLPGRRLSLLLRLPCRLAGLFSCVLGPDGAYGLT